MSDSTDIQSVLCLCPTYGRPTHLIANTIQCFLDQEYLRQHPERVALLILDDLGNLSIDTELHNRGVHLLSTQARYPSLPAKYNDMRNLGPRADIELVWEDDEIYLPHHIGHYVTAMNGKKWAHPSQVWSTYTGTPQIEQSGGRFHAALGFRSWFLDSIGGWPETDEPNFDQQLIAKSVEQAIPGRPDTGDNTPSYVFRWADTGANHGQGTMDLGNDWYRAARPQYTDRVHLTLEDIRHDDAARKAIAAIAASQL